jgi:hypothetical protein
VDIGKEASSLHTEWLDTGAVSLQPEIEEEQTLTSLGIKKCAHTHTPKEENQPDKT